MVRAKPLMFLVFASFLALGTGLFVRNWVTSERGALVVAPAPPAVQPAVRVLVARDALPAGHILKPQDLGWQAWPDLPSNAPYVMNGTKQPEAFAGAVVRLPMLAGEPVTADRLIEPGDRGFLAAVLPSNMRAASVAVTATSGVSGFVLPGDRVDVVLTHVFAPQGSKTEGTPGTAAPDHRAAETVLRDLRVLAVDQKLESKAGEAFVAHTATLEVTEKQSEALALAAEMGKLSLSLRSLASDDAAVDGAPDARSATLDSQVSAFLPPLVRTHADEGVRVSVLHAGKADDMTLKRGK
ncbi:MAG: putative pilus assembly protein CpaB [Rhodospirillales bacterium]|nr:putative pilus assembly protein CpaB [Rhodospirillales bacterium]